MSSGLYTLQIQKKLQYAEEYAEFSKKAYDYSVFETCPLCGARISGGKWLEPKEIPIMRKKAPDCLVCYGIDTGSYLFSERAVQAFRQAGITGIEKVEKIRVFYYKETDKLPPPPDYYAITTARSRITIDHQRSEITYLSTAHEHAPCPLCDPTGRCTSRTDRLEYNMELFEGYDIFRTYERGNTTFVSQKFIDTVRENALTGFWCAAVELPNEVFPIEPEIKRHRRDSKHP